jgi:hypothetical protein
MSELERKYGTADWYTAQWREVREGINLYARQLQRRVYTAVEADLKRRYENGVLGGDGFSLTDGEIRKLVTDRMREVAELERGTA